MSACDPCRRRHAPVRKFDEAQALRTGMIVKPLQKRSTVRPHKLRVFCFPYAGAGVSVFRGLSALVPPTVQLFGIQLPGREERWIEPPYTELDPLVENVAKEVLRYTDVPTVLFGHSFGALIAYEVASWLERRAQVGVAGLVVSAAHAPGRSRHGPLLHRLADQRFLDELETFGGFPPEVLQHTELLSLVLPALRADVKLYETYEHRLRPRLYAPVRALGGSSDPRVSRHDLLQWGAVTNYFLGMQVFPGGHFYFHQSPQAVLHSILATASLHPLCARGVTPSSVGL